jgi:hypothetical protein
MEQKFTLVNFWCFHPFSLCVNVLEHLRSDDC